MASIRRRRVTSKSKGGSRTASVGGTSQTSFAGASMSTFEPPAEEVEGERPKADDLAREAAACASGGEQEKQEEKQEGTNGDTDPE